MLLELIAVDFLLVVLILSIAWRVGHRSVRNPEHLDAQAHVRTVRRPYDWQREEP